MRRILSLLFAVFATISSVMGQTYPEPSDQFVNDFAQILKPEDTAGIRQALMDLQATTEVEATVVTLENRDGDTPIEDFATGLFNAWGIGDAGRNDGILILVVPGERVARIELGSAYSQDFDTIAADILQRSVLPYFRDGDISNGVARATTEVIDRIAKRKAANLAPEPPADAGGNWLPWIIGAVFAAIVARRVVGKRVGDAAVRLRRCPSCGRRTLSRRRLLAVRPTKTMDGAWHLNTRCDRCDWHETRDERIPRGSRVSRRGGGGGGSFGGGRSSGGGATGRW